MTYQDKYEQLRAEFIKKTDKYIKADKELSDVQGFFDSLLIDKLVQAKSEFEIACNNYNNFLVMVRKNNVKPMDILTVSNMNFIVKKIDFVKNKSMGNLHGVPVKENFKDFEKVEAFYKKNKLLIDGFINAAINKNNTGVGWVIEVQIGDLKDNPFYQLLKFEITEMDKDTVTLVLLDVLFKNP